MLWQIKVTEYEHHFILVCPVYRDIRQGCLPAYYWSLPTASLFKNLLSSNQRSMLNQVAK